ncbi:RDD family protein [Lichenifustis flavocetrariae]
MSQTSIRWSQPLQPFPMRGRAGLPVGALDSVRTRRILAVCFDFIAVSIFSFGLWLALLVLTLGLSLVLLPPLFPFVAFFYNGLTVSGRKMATPGMRAMGLEIRTNDSGDRVTFLAAAVHAVLFYFSWMFPPIFLWSLFSEDKRCLHDVFADVIVVRRI